MNKAPQAAGNSPLLELNYIHENPAKALLVHHAEAYYFSSAIDYADSKGLFTISKI